MVKTVGWIYFSLIVVFPGTFTGTDLVDVLVSTIGYKFSLSVYTGLCTTFFLIIGVYTTLYLMIGCYTILYVISGWEITFLVTTGLE